MTNFDDYYAEKMKDPKFAAAQKKLAEQSDYYKAHPDECPHEAIVAPVDLESGEDQPGHCLDCGQDNVMTKEDPND